MRSKAAATDFVFRNAVTEDISQLTGSKRLRDPEALTIHVDAAAVLEHDGVPARHGLAVQFICRAVHFRLIASRKQDLIRHDDG